MKIKVLKTTKTTKDGKSFVSYFTPVMIVVKGEEEKGEQQKGLTLNFSKQAIEDVIFLVKTFLLL